MSTFSPNRLPKDSNVLASRKEARAVLDAYRGFLASPALQNNVDLAVLTKIAADESMPVRERRRSAEMLAKFRLKAMETLASLEAVREQILKDLGIDASTKNVSMTQVNNTIEIVRQSDWRGSASGDHNSARDAEATVVEPDGEPEP